MARVVVVTYKGKTEDGDVFEEVTSLPVIIGSGELLEDVEKVLEEMKEGESRTLSLEKPFGERDPKKIVLINIREFRRRGIEPYPGMRVEVNGVPGRVLSVTGGRVQVDLNHPLAGRNVVYELTLEKVLEEVEAFEKLFERFVGVPPKEIDMKDGVVRVVYPYTGRDEGEKVFVAAVLANFPDIKEVRVERIYIRAGSDKSSDQGEEPLPEPQQT